MNEAGTAGAPSSERVIARTRDWVERAVIGLNLCPFAKAVHVGGQIRYAVSAASDADALLADLERELRLLAAAPPQQVETTLLVHPHVLADFLDYNDFLDIADGAVEALGYAGVFQVASFHPQYQFEGTAADDVTNFSNRSPYPTLHLLREDSVERAVRAFPEADSIYLRNVETLRRIGLAGWREIVANGAPDDGAQRPKSR